ncbi:nuclear transport factor 2 family protein [Pseudonocardia sp. HH130630-07]|uniref:nuclear transport factor 2 family protein n=1 Tax=Pseudonocardia sp. HH130630-07 TaxID=1690815 RepID=UPI001E380A3B|nr:nuclear transport factor 2 family protein [Pseudonocardia sp. HH130630-07]
MTLRRLLDRAEIHDVQLRYALGTDSRDWELFRSCFADRVLVDFSEGFGRPAALLDADEWVAGTAPRMESFAATQHMITNVTITFDDEDHAGCLAHVQATHHLPTATGGSDQTVHGYYDNRFERTPDGWRMSAVRLVPRWMTGNFGVFRAALAHEQG